MSKIYFFRHAQASYLADDYDKLSELGEKQSAKLGAYLVSKNIKFNKIFTGPLVRQQATCDIVRVAYHSKNLVFPEPLILPNLKEHAGPEAMKSILPELMKSSPKVKALYDKIAQEPKLLMKNSLLSFQYFMQEWAEGKIVVPEFESWNEFRIACRNGLKEILEQTEKGETIGVFTSGGTISAIVAEALKLEKETTIAELNFSVRNTSFSSFLYSKDQFNLLSFNELPHLEEKMVTFV